MTLTDALLALLKFAALDWQIETILHNDDGFSLITKGGIGWRCLVSVRIEWEDKKEGKK